MNNPQIFKVLNGFQKTVRYFYVALVALVIFYTARGYLTGATEWASTAVRVLTGIELFLIVIYFGIIVCIKAFSRLEGDLLGSELEDVIEVWGWLGDKIRDLLVYNGILGFAMFSLFL